MLVYIFEEFRKITTSVQKLYFWANLDDLCQFSSLLGSLSPPHGLAWYRRFFSIIETYHLNFGAHVAWMMSILKDFKVTWSNFTNMADLFKWLCQQDAHRNSVQKDVLYHPHIVPKSHSLNNSCGYRTFCQNVNLNSRINKYARSIGLINIHVNK